MKVWSSINPGLKSVLPILVSIFLMGCASSKGPLRPGYDRGSGGYPAGSRERAVGFTETGIISFYADKFHGRKTANGETFNMHAFTAAHRTLPFHSKVRVTNLANGKSVVVEVNDRGPFAANRILDLSPAAARKIDLIKSGTTKATVTVE